MANPYINIYNDNPTAGLTDGVAVSTEDSFTNPISANLDAEQNETYVQKCAIRTEDGYNARNGTINAANDADSRWSFCKTEAGEFTDSLSFDEITNVNTIFYVKASSVDTEHPQVDRSVKVRFFGKLVAV